MADVKIFALNSTESMEAQVNELANCDAYKNSTIRVMADGHVGKSGPVGFVCAYIDKIIPFTIGSDIACRVSLIEFPVKMDFFKSEENLAAFDEWVHKHIPTGFNVRNKEAEASKNFPYENLRCWWSLKNHDRIRKSLGTLGGGNHYCELDYDENGRVYFSVHCGSRNLGKQVCEYYQNKAIENRDRKGFRIHLLRDAEIEQAKIEGNVHLIQGIIEDYKRMKEALPMDDLCYLEGQDMEDYLHDMKLCNEWSYLSHHTIITEVLGFFKGYVGFNDKMYTCIHNYVDVDNGLIRKGAINASLGEVCIIPLNMRDGIILGRGKGNEDYLCSAPHGAGRLMSRGEARRTLSMEDFTKSMNGIYTSCIDSSTIDEAPMAYKDAQSIIAAIEPTVEVINHLLPIWNFKAKN